MCHFPRNLQSLNLPDVSYPQTRDVHIYCDDDDDDWRVRNAHAPPCDGGVTRHEVVVVVVHRQTSRPEVCSQSDYLSVYSPPVLIISLRLTY